MEQIPHKAMSTSTLRILLLSDTHNTNPSIPSSALSSTDLILHAGDLTNSGTPDEIQKQLTWLRKLSGCSCDQCHVEDTRVRGKAPDDNAKKESKGMPLIFIAGNHDLCLDASWYAIHGSNAHNQPSPSMRDAKAEEIRADLQNARACNVQYLENGPSSIQLQTKRDGKVIHLNVFGTPMSPTLHGTESRWSAFTYEDKATSTPGLKSIDEAEELLSSIPMETSILLSHSPPYGILDIDRHGHHSGCRLLWKHIQRVKPRLVVCGHRHEGRGCIKIVWTAESGSVKEAWSWKDPGKESIAKLSLVSQQKADLWEPFNLLSDVNNQHEAGADDSDSLKHSQIQPELQDNSSCIKPRLSSIDGGHCLPEDSLPESGDNINRADKECKGVLNTEFSTIIINASIMGTSYQRGGEKKFNKPIFVDLTI